MESFQNKTVKCVENSSALFAPWFIPDLDEQDSKNEEPNLNYQKDINDFFDKYELPNELRVVYLSLNSPNKQFVYKPAVFLSFKEIKNYIDFYLSKGVTSFIDFGLISTGMGHCAVLAFNIKDKAFFIRNGGGSSNYDRISNLNFILEFDFENFPETKLLNFEKLVENINHFNEEEYFFSEIQNIII